MQRSERMREEWHFSAGDVQAGKYKLLIGGLEYAIVIDVGPQGEQAARLVVPPPGDLAVRLQDVESGEQIVLEYIKWACKRPEGVTSGGLEHARPGADGVYRFRAPVGPVNLRIWDANYAFSNKIIDVQPGQNDHTVQMTRSCGLAFELREGDHLVPWPDGVDATVEAIEGKGRSTSRHWGASRIRMGVSEPGLYRLEITDIPGYEPIPDQEVRIWAGEFTELLIELIPRR